MYRYSILTKTILRQVLVISRFQNATKMKKRVILSSKFLFYKTEMAKISSGALKHKKQRQSKQQTFLWQ